jgi:hypothetical protein
MSSIVARARQWPTSDEAPQLSSPEETRGTSYGSSFSFVKNPLAPPRRNKTECPLQQHKFTIPKGGSHGFSFG